MGKWLVIVFESKTENSGPFRRAMEAAGGKIVWSGDQRPLVVVRPPRPEKEAELSRDPRLSELL